MTAVLLVLVLAQPGINRPTLSPIEQAAGQRLIEASTLYRDNPEKALQLLSDLLADPRFQEAEATSPLVRSYRDSARYTRAYLLVQKGDAGTVVADMTEIIERERQHLIVRAAGLVGSLATQLPASPIAAATTVPPALPLTRTTETQALMMRSQAWEALGEHEKAMADQARAQQITRDVLRAMGQPAYDYEPGAGPWFANFAISLEDIAATLTSPLLVLIVFVVMIPVFILSGLRQRRDARGTWRRLFWVAVALAAIQVVPLVAACLLAWWRPWYLGTTPLAFMTFMVFFINIFRHRAYLSAVTWQGSRDAPPLLEDAAILARIEQLAQRVGVAPPVARLVRSGSALQMNNAMISGLAAPTMVLYDGILYRLSEEERDAIIAHELGHLANHTFWVWILAGLFCSVAVVVASAFFQALVVVGLGTTLLTGTWLILSRRLELDCDRRAARAMGHRNAASALWKIHADQPMRGLVEFLVGAVATHPSRDERLAAIHRDAPLEDKPEVTWNPRLLAGRHLAAWLAAGLWLTVIVGCLVWGYRNPYSLWPAVPLFLMEGSLFALFFLALRKSNRRRGRLLRTRRTWRAWWRWALGIVMTSYVLLHFLGVTERFLGRMNDLWLLACTLPIWLALATLLGRSDKAKDLNRRVAIAIHSNDYRAALALCEGRPAVVARSPELRYNQALIRAVLGQRTEALDALEQLRQDEPAFKMTWLLLASLYADEGNHARALEMASELSRDLPGDPFGPQAEAWLLRKLGRLDEAEARARTLVEKDPQSSQAYLTLAGVALDRGDHAAARELMTQAERVTPGTMAAALIAAELALVTDDPAAADVIAHAVERARNNPLAFADKEAAELARRLEARRQPPSEGGDTDLGVSGIDP
jgi:Zn-dependent protease with chaperone function/tetratricopeptide (TPR) repeat protein